MRHLGPGLIALGFRGLTALGFRRKLPLGFRRKLPSKLYENIGVGEDDGNRTYDRGANSLSRNDRTRT
jgi:hypothetical protein